MPNVELSTPALGGGFFLYTICIRNPPVTQGTLPPRHTLSVKDAAALEPFYRAQRPHGAALTWQQLRKAGATPKPKEDPSLKFVCDAFNAAYDADLDYAKVTSSEAGTDTDD